MSPIPISFIARAARTVPTEMLLFMVAVDIRGQKHSRSRQLASALNRQGIGRGDTVAFMGSNTPELYEAHFGIPMTGAVLNALNIRLDAAAIAFILDHGEAKVLFTDTIFQRPFNRRWKSQTSIQLSLMWMMPWHQMELYRESATMRLLSLKETLILRGSYQQMSGTQFP